MLLIGYYNSIKVNLFQNVSFLFKFFPICLSEPKFPMTILQSKYFSKYPFCV